MTALRFETKDETSDIPGLPAGTQDRYITLTHLRNRFQPTTVTAGTIPDLRSIICNRLREQGLLFARLRE